MEKLRAGDGKAKVVIKPLNGKQLRVGLGSPRHPYLLPGLHICITLMRIRIELFTSMRIRIELFTSMRIRILLLKVTGICDHWSVNPPRPILSIQSSIVSVHCGSIFSHADPDPASKNKMRIRIRNPAFYNWLPFKFTVTAFAWVSSP
jgi:hypothetical protein